MVKNHRKVATECWKETNFQTHTNEIQKGGAPARVRVLTSPAKALKGGGGVRGSRAAPTPGAKGPFRPHEQKVERGEGKERTARVERLNLVFSNILLSKKKTYGNGRCR